MAVQGATYEIFQIRSADGERVVDLYEGQFRVGNIYYYENILSPQITGIITIVRWSIEMLFTFKLVWGQTYST